LQRPLGCDNERLSQRNDMTIPGSERKQTRNRRSGLTLIELIVAFTILLILSTMALPLARVKVQREKERRLRDALTEMRKAIDRYKDMADAGQLGQIDPETMGYPPSLEVMVEGVTVQSTGMAGGIFGQGQQQQMPGQSQGGFGGAAGGAFGGSRGRSPSQGGRGAGVGGTGFGGGFGTSSGSTSSRSTSSGREDGEQLLRFLRRIPTDPITGSQDWGLRSVQDDPNAMSWGGQNVFDVYTRSMDRSLDGTPYSEW
jgi:prepilin-type N-terminal cleavage/methylation domain-containing protein